MKFILILCLLFSASTLKAQTDTVKVISTDSAIYSNPEIHAGFPLGPTAWDRYLTKNLKYPTAKINTNGQNTVIVQFIVDSTGITRDIKAISGPEELRTEAIRVVSSSGRWSAAVNDGKHVNSVCTMPVKFALLPR